MMEFVVPNNSFLPVTVILDAENGNDTNPIGPFKSMEKGAFFPLLLPLT